MKKLLKQSMITLASAFLLTLHTAASAKATLFDQTEVEQSNFIAVAVPRGAFGSGGYKLLILEQKSNTRDCWSEQGHRPVIVEPLLLSFDFTSICGRATDSNGYSIRIGGQDLALNYTLSLQSVGGDILLVGTGRDPSAPRLVIGRTQGLASGFLKIILEPGWRFTKRTYQGQVLGHIYLTNDGRISNSGSYPR